MVVVTSKPAVLADPVPPDIVEGRGDRSDPSQAKEVNHQAVEFEVLCPILIKKCTKGQHKARTTQMQLGLLSQKPVQQGLLRARAPKAVGACSGPKQQM